MKSNILSFDRASLLAMSRAMTPEQRISAFFKHSRLIHQVYKNGALSRRSSLHKKKPSSQ